MDTSTLRWILIIAGLALLGGLFLFGSPEKRPKRRASRARKKPNRRKTERASRREPTLDDEAPSEELSRFTDPPLHEPTLEAGQAELPMGEPAMDEDAGPAPTAAKPPSQEPAGPPPEKVVVLYLQARDNRKIVGVELLDAALNAGMNFGDMDIFHRTLEGTNQSVFSMANLTAPGQFDKSSWPTLETKGVTLFLGLPGPMNALDAWDAMVATSRRLAELLHLDILDDQQAIFTRHREGEIREELRAFERSQLPEG